MREGGRQTRRKGDVVGDKETWREGGREGDSIEKRRKGREEWIRENEQSIKKVLRERVTSGPLSLRFIARGF